MAKDTGPTAVALPIYAGSSNAIACANPLPDRSTTADFTDCEANNIAGLASASAARRQGPSCAAA